MTGVSEAIIHKRNQVAVLLASSRTRLDKSRWSAIQRLLQQVDGRNIPDPDWERQLLAEYDFLRTLTESIN